MNEKVSHSGIVTAVTARNVTVKIAQMSACSGCQLKSMCSSAEKKDKLITVKCNDADRWKEGDKVVVSASVRMGMKAVILAFVIPLLLIISCLVTAITLLKMSDAASSLGALLLLAVYYTLLYRYRKKIERNFIFEITN